MNHPIVTTLTQGEMCRIWRRRSDIKVTDLAANLGVGRGSVVRWESDEAPPPAELWLQDGGPRVITRVTPGEYATIARRRSRLSQREVAKRRDTTRITINKQERDLTATALELAMWWEPQFPPNEHALYHVMVG